MEKFNNKYRISSSRLKGHDYSSTGLYFITICTKNREPFFGTISPLSHQMQLSEIGETANECWQKIPMHFPFVELGEWVLMPNHIHGIIIINLNVRLGSQPKGNIFGPQSQNLASIIRGFKIGVTKYARLYSNIYDVWQPRYYDHIIRNEDEFNRITKYIINNPQNWSTVDEMVKNTVKNNANETVNEN
jgi:putative transposase